MKSVVLKVLIAFLTSLLLALQVNASTITLFSATPPTASTWSMSSSPLGRKYDYGSYLGIDVDTTSQSLDNSYNIGYRIIPSIITKYYSWNLFLSFKLHGTYQSKLVVSDFIVNTAPSSMDYNPIVTVCLVSSGTTNYLNVQSGKTVINSVADYCTRIGRINMTLTDTQISVYYQCESGSTWYQLDSILDTFPRPRTILSGFSTNINAKKRTTTGIEKRVSEYISHTQIHSNVLTAVACANDDCIECKDQYSCVTCKSSHMNASNLCKSCDLGYNFTEIIANGETNAVCNPICQPHCSCVEPSICEFCIPPWALKDRACLSCIESHVYDPTTGNCISKTDIQIQSSESNLNCTSIDASSNPARCPSLSCYYCENNRKCLNAEADCPLCDDYTKNNGVECGVSLISETCMYCQTQKACISNKATCLDKCENAKESCNAYDGCQWCSYTQSCMDINAISTCVSSCIGLTSESCSNSTTCSWCSVTQSCLELSEVCSSCIGLPEDQCKSQSPLNCSWCLAENACKTPDETCNTCSGAGFDKCGFGSYVGCNQCFATQSCLSTTPSSSSCDCSSQTTKNACFEKKAGCSWCDGTNQCLERRDNITCIPCASRNETTCLKPENDCRWSKELLSCVFTNFPVIPCSYLNNNTCKSPYIGCQLCESETCIYIDEECSVQSSTNNIETPENANKFPKWAIIVAGVGGGGCLLIAIASVFVCIGIASRRRKNKKSTSSSEERNGIDLAGIAGLTTGELAGMHETTAEELMIDVSKTMLSFGGGKKTVLKLDIPVEETFDIKNNGKGEARITIHIPPEEETDGKFELHISPQDFNLQPDEATTITVKMIPKCTMALKTGIAIWRRPARSFCIVNIEGTTEPSTRLDWNELEILGEIGHGGFGTVYKAKWRGLPVAVKEMASHLFELPETKAEVMREVDLMSRLRSPFVVCFHGVILTKAHKAIVMELAPMGSLGPLLRKQQIPMDVKIKIASNCAHGMQMLHTNSILHRDLKPDNLLVFSLNPNEEVLVKLTDFGTSRNVADEEARQYTKGIGTPVYMAPELLNSKKYGMTADVYSFGVLLWELVAQTVPYEDLENHFAIVKFVSDGKRLEIPDSPLKDLTSRCWAQNPAERPTFNQIVSDIESIVH